MPKLALRTSVVKQARRAVLLQRENVLP